MIQVLAALPPDNGMQLPRRKRRAIRELEERRPQPFATHPAPDIGRRRKCERIVTPA